MSSFSTAKPRPINPLDRVIKKNPKYEHVKSTLDTGSSLTKYLNKIEEIKTNYRYQQDEIFKRMKISTFVQLLLQVAEVDSVEKDCQRDFDSNRSYYGDDNNAGGNQAAGLHLAMLSDRNSEFNGASSTNRHSTLQSVIKGVGELDLTSAAAPKQQQQLQQQQQTHPPATAAKSFSRKMTSLDRDLLLLQPAQSDAPYLLLDIRDKDEYDRCHMITAMSYPTSMLSRSINNETAELLAYKNQPGKIIVIYDDDERIGPRSAATLVERGYDNLFLLSGGLKLAFRKFPQGLIAGAVPSFYMQTGRHSQDKSASQTAAAVGFGVPATPMSGWSSTRQKNAFDRDDIDKLNQYLEAELMPSSASSASSRFSRNSKSSRNSEMSDRISVGSSKTTSSIHDKPWRPN